MVYILSSPTGPRAILLSGSQTFYTPIQPLRYRRSGSPAPPIAPAIGATNNMNVSDIRNRAAQRAARRVHRHRHENAPEDPVAAHPANPGAGALAAQIWPHIWLILRLMGFIWFFTAGNNSWSRWLVISGLAVTVFIINTGIFDGVAQQIWGPIRRHLEGLLPLAGPDAAVVPAANAAAIQPGQAPPLANGASAHNEPDPAQAAARLVEQHRRANGGWLMAQVRRAEHALLLFLASLVPGVGERHIAAREAEAAVAEAERQRRIEAAASTGAGNSESATGSNAGETANPRAEGARDDQNQNGQDAVAPVQPLIEV